jgi:hypothetical protein
MVSSFTNLNYQNLIQSINRQQVQIGNISALLTIKIKENMKSFITYKVVNADLFNSVDEVELTLKSYGGTYKFKYRDAYFLGDVSIEINGEWKTISGQHGANDYEDYGFQIVKEYVREDDEDKHWRDVETYKERNSY